jgi:hypothetical protein
MVRRGKAVGVLSDFGNPAIGEQPMCRTLPLVPLAWRPVGSFKFLARAAAAVRASAA